MVKGGWDERQLSLLLLGAPLRQTLWTGREHRTGRNLLTLDIRCSIRVTASSTKREWSWLTLTQMIQLLPRMPLFLRFCNRAELARYCGGASFCLTAGCVLEFSAA